MGSNAKLPALTRSEAVIGVSLVTAKGNQRPLIVTSLLRDNVVVISAAVDEETLAVNN